MMDKRELKIDYFVCRDGLPTGYEDLCQRAMEASRTAYSIYSGFSVGVAVLLDNGGIVTGSNQENSAYPSGLCAERTALFYAGAQYPRCSVVAMALAACYNGELREESVTPCAACRQVMSEVVLRYGKDFDVIMVGKKESIVVKASALLPFTFVFSEKIAER